jgi:phosphoribosylanthranilate isomerase
MPPTWIKICGIREPAAALAAVQAGANAIGLNFVADSPRLVTAERAREIAAELPPSVEPVALFADAAADAIRRTCDTAGIRTVQLHGRESPGFAAGLAPLRVFKALHYRAGILAELPAWVDAGVATIFLDTQPRAGLTGGSGQAFSWTDLDAERRRSAPSPGTRLVLAGGLTPENVADAIRLLRPFGVDISSGVESSRGVKDPAKIRAFCAAVRATDGQ